MNKTRFRLLVFFMSLSLIGIILVQLYWVSSSLKGSDEQFKFHIQQVLGKVTNKLQEQEEAEFFDNYKKFTDSTKRFPSSEGDMMPFYYNRGYQREDNDIIYSNNLNSRDYQDMFFESSTREQNNITDTIPAAKPATENVHADAKTNVTSFQRVQYENLFRSFRRKRDITERIPVARLRKMLESELRQMGVETPFEFAIYNNGLATKVRSENFVYDKRTAYNHAIFTENDGTSRYSLFVSFPQKQVYLFGSIVGITSLSLVFTLIIIIAYLSAINQLIKQKQISEIKTDFINNMTHEFKTPIATINLALDAIKNPKIMDDAEKRQRYLQMIRDENKRMHSQVENVLQISRLDKKELDIEKEQANIQDILEDAIEHVHLIVEARHGSITRHFEARRTTTLINEVHFTNVLVNILDNAIKYSPDEPVIDIYTENVKDYVVIKIQDQGLGMSKNVQKRIFEKFYREHTGDIHNVKGHGLGLAYVKRIIDDHNCHIYVESEKGKGSIFIIKMPLIN